MSAALRHPGPVAGVGRDRALRAAPLRGRVQGVRRGRRDAVSCPQDARGGWKNPARTAIAPVSFVVGSGAQADVARAWFARALWQAFPGPSEAAVADLAARRLGVSARQVRNWLRCDHDAGLRHVAAVIMILGAGSVAPLVSSARRV